MGDEAPAHEAQLALAAGGGEDDGDGLAGGDVVARGQVGQTAGEQELAGQTVGIGLEGVATAHDGESYVGAGLLRGGGAIPRRVTAGTPQSRWGGVAVILDVVMATDRGRWRIDLIIGDEPPGRFDEVLDAGIAQFDWADR